MPIREAAPAVRTDEAKAGAGTATVATTDTALLAANPQRVEVTICNTDAANPVFLALGIGTTAALNSGVQIKAGGSYTTTSFTGAIRAIAGTGAVVVSYVEI